MSLKDRWRTFRNRMIARPGFQAFAAAFPLTRPIARARSKALFDLIAGFTYSQTLVACLELDLIARLADGPATLESLAKALDFAPDRLERLLKAAVSLDILEKTSSGAFDLGIHGAALLGNPWIAGFIRHHPILYDDLRDPIAVLRDPSETGLSRYWAYAGAGEGQTSEKKDVSAYTALMAASQAAVAREILALHDFSDCDEVLDIGGSNGSFIVAAAARYPQLRFTLFDLPAVAGLAAENFEKSGISNRAKAIPGSFLTDPLPKTAQVATLIRVLHDHDDESALRILEAAHACLPQGGRLILAEPLSGDAATAPISDGYFGLYFAAMGQGKTRTPGEIAQIAQKAGFQTSEPPRTRMPLITSVIVLRR